MTTKEKSRVLEHQSLALLNQAVAIMEESFSSANLPSYDSSLDQEQTMQLQAVLNEVATRLKDNFPYPHPLYAGQMIKPPHVVARLAYTLALWFNPNNHALDGGRASSLMEKEAVANLASMLGFEQHLGHLTSGGTMANLEALWVADRLHPGKTIVASSQAHYTHSRISEVLKIPFKSVPVDAQARMDVLELESMLKSNDIGTVVVTTGTTAVGSVDPLIQILELQKKYKFRIHIDAAYGGYFKLADNLSNHARRVFDALGEADSIVIDPHKHGLQPYGCGCVLFKDPSVGRFYKHDSPYTYFSSNELHLGEISLECSRPGASAVALWATQKMLPMETNSLFAKNISTCRKTALDFCQKLMHDERFTVPFEPELDIVVFAVNAKSASESSKMAKVIFARAADAGLHLAVANLPAQFFKDKMPGMAWDQDTIACLRSCLMKPEHQEWLPEIWGILTNSVLRNT